MSSIAAPSRTSSVVRTSWRTLRHEGAHALVMRALAMGLHRRLLVLERDNHLDPAYRAPDIELELGRVDDVDELLMLRPELSRNVLDRLRDAGSIFLGAWHAGELVSVRWMAFDRARIEYLDRSLELSPDECYLADSYTAPACRRHHVNAALSRYSQEQARDAGRTRCVACVLPENTVAMKVILHYGYRVTGRIGWTGIGPLRRYFVEREGAPLRWAPL